MTDSTVKIKIQIADEDISQVADAIRGPNAATPAIDSDAAQHLVEQWRSRTPVNRQWRPTSAGIIGTEGGVDQPNLWIWPPLPDGLYALGDAPFVVTITEYERTMSDAEALDLMERMLTTTVNSSRDLLAQLGSIVAATGRAS